MGIQAKTSRHKQAGRARKQAGDTIVEVLIAILIVSTVLVAAFQTTTHSTRVTQAVQEESVALKLAETQVEFLRQANGLDTAASKCFAITSAPSANDTECDTLPNGPGTDPAYTATITKVSNIYRVDVTWAGMNSPQETVTMFYRPVD